MRFAPSVTAVLLLIIPAAGLAVPAPEVGAGDVVAEGHQEIVGLPTLPTCGISAGGLPTCTVADIVALVDTNCDNHTCHRVRIDDDLPGGAGNVLDTTPPNQRASRDLYWGTERLWHSGNDGAASGLDADSVDGYHAGDFALVDHLHDQRYFTKAQLSTPGTLNEPANPVDWTRLKGVPGAFADGIDNNTEYAAGDGLVLTGTTLGIDASVTQRRVTGICAEGFSIRAIDAAGAVACEPDDDTTYTAGSGLALQGTTFSVAVGGVTGAMILDGTVDLPDLAFDAATQTELQAHAAGADHDGRYYTEAESDARFLGSTATAANAELLDGLEGSSFLMATGTAADSALLDGMDSSAFAAASHGHNDQYYTEVESDARFLGLTATAANAELLDGLDGSAFLLTTGTAADSERLDGLDSSAFAVASHGHNDQYYTEVESDARFLGLTATAADAELLDGIDSVQLLRSDQDGTLAGNLALQGRLGIGTGNPTVALDVVGDAALSGTLLSGSVPWGRLTDFPAACGAGAFVTAIGTSLTCNIPPSLGGGWVDDGTVVRLAESTDRVGIGTSAPRATLHLVTNRQRQDVRIETTEADPAPDPHIMLFKNTSSGQGPRGFTLVTRAHNDQRFDIADTTRDDGTGEVRFTIDKDGDVGIGTTVPDAGLHVVARPTQVGIKFGDGNGVGYLHAGGADVFLGTNDQKKVVNIDQGSHNVGIGPVDPTQQFQPAEQLEVRGNLMITKHSSSAQALRFNNPDIAGDWYVDAHAGNFRIHEWEPSNVERFTIRPGGNVGIGTNNPSDRLTVSGVVQSTTGGFRFPDGSIQTTAAAPGGFDRLLESRSSEFTIRSAATAPGGGERVGWLGEVISPLPNVYPGSDAGSAVDGSLPAGTVIELAAVVRARQSSGSETSGFVFSGHTNGQPNWVGFVPGESLLHYVDASDSVPRTVSLRGEADNTTSVWHFTVTLRESAGSGMRKADFKVEADGVVLADVDVIIRSDVGLFNQIGNPNNGGMRVALLSPPMGRITVP